MNNQIKVGDVVFLMSDTKLTIPMTVFSVYDDNVWCYWIHPITQDVVEKKFHKGVFIMSGN